MGSFDFGVGMAFWLMVGSAILCVVYGALKWNKDKNEELIEVSSWEDAENKINEEF